MEATRVRISLFVVIIFLLSIYSSLFADFTIEVAGNQFNEITEVEYLDDILLSIIPSDKETAKDFAVILSSDEGTFGSECEPMILVTPKTIKNYTPISFNYEGKDGLALIHLQTAQEADVSFSGEIITVPPTTEVFQIAVFDMTLDVAKEADPTRTFEAITFAINYEGLNYVPPVKVVEPTPELTSESVIEYSPKEIKDRPAIKFFEINREKLSNNNVLASSDNILKSNTIRLRNVVNNLLPADFDEPIAMSVEVESASLLTNSNDSSDSINIDSRFRLPEELQLADDIRENRFVPSNINKYRKSYAAKPLITGTGFPSQKEFETYHAERMAALEVELSTETDTLQSITTSDVTLASVALASESTVMAATTNTESTNTPGMFPGYSNDTEEWLERWIPQDCTDINGDNIVDMLDFSRFAVNWLESGDELRGDFDENSIVNISDLDELAYWWLNDPGCGIYYSSELPYQTSFEPMQGYTISELEDTEDPNAVIPFTASYLDGVQGWRVEDGLAALVWRDYVYMDDDPNNLLVGYQNCLYSNGGTCYKRFIDNGTDNRFIHFEIVPGKNSEVVIADEDTNIAGIKFDFVQSDPNDPNTADYNIYVWNGDPNDGTDPGYINSGFDYQWLFRLVNTYGGKEAPIRLQFMFDMDWEAGLYDICMGVDGAPTIFNNNMFLFAWNMPLGGDTFDRVKVISVRDEDATEGHDEGFTLFDRLMIHDYDINGGMLQNYPSLDPDTPWELIPCAIDLKKPCQCDTEENALQEALTPVLGTYMGYSTAGYNIMCCPVEEGDMEWFRDGNEEDLVQSFIDNKWYVSDIRHKLRPGYMDNLGWFRTGIIPNGYYYLTWVIFSDVTAENGYAVPAHFAWLDHRLEDISGYVHEEQPASTLAVSCNQKGQPYRTSYETAIKVPWAGDATGLPFELTHYYSSNNCLKAKPFYNGWNCSFEYTLVEDTRFNFEYHTEGSDPKTPYDDRYGYGIGFGFVSIKKPDGSGQVFRHESGSTTDGEAVYYPYPDNGSNDKVIRKTYTSNGYLTRITYTAITGDGKEYYFVDDSINVELPTLSPLVGWRSDAKVDSIKDRFNNTINVDWAYSFGNYRIDSASIGSGETERKIKFYDGDEYNYIDPDGFIDRAALIVGSDENNPVREVKYSIDHESVHDFYSYYFRMPYTQMPRYLTEFKIAETNSYVDRFGEYDQYSSDSNKYESYSYHPDMSGYIVAKYQFNLTSEQLDIDDMWYDEWGSVREIYHPIEPVVEEDNSFYKAPADIFTYEHYTADLDDIYYIDPNNIDGNWLKVTHHKTAGWLSTEYYYQGYADDYGYKTISVYDSYGRIQGQRILNKDDVIVNEYVYLYYSIDTTNGTKPYQIDQYFDGKHKVTELTYDNKGNLETKKEYDVTKLSETKYEEYTWHDYYTLSESSTKWQVYGDDSSITGDVIVYGKNDGSISGSASENIYAVQQKKIIEVGNIDPISLVYATSYMTYEADGRLKTIIDPESKKQEIVYDDFGYRKKVYAVDENNDLYLTNRYKHDSIGQQLMEVDNRGVMSIRNYDGHGRMYSKKIYENLQALTTGIDDPNFVYGDYKVEYLTGFDNRDNAVCQWFQNYAQTIDSNYIFTIYNNLDQPIQKYYYEWFGQLVGSDPQIYIKYLQKRFDQFGYDYMGNLEVSVIEDLGDGCYLSQFFYDEFNREVFNREYEYCDYDTNPIPDVRRVTRKYYDSIGNVVEQRLYFGEDMLESLTANVYDIFGRHICMTVDPENLDDPNAVTEFNLTTLYSYDACDNTICVTDPKGNKIYSDYDNANREVEKYFATNNETKVTRKAIQYYNNSQVKRVTEFDRDGFSVLSDSEFVYDYRNRIKTTYQDIDGIDYAQTDIYYNDFDPLVYNDPNNSGYYPAEFAGNLQYDLRIVDAENKSTWRKLDYNNKVTEMLYPSGLKRKFGYYPDGKLYSNIVYNSVGTEQLVTFQRDGYGRVSKKEYPDGSYVAYELDYLDQMVSAGIYELGSETPLSEYTYTYAELNQIQTITDQDGFVSCYEYYADNQIQSITIGTDPETDPNSIYTAFYDYDRARRLSAVMTGYEFSDLSLMCNYDDNGNLENVGYMNGGLFPFTEIDYTYNLDNQLDSLTGAYFSLGNMVIDGKGRIKSAQSFRPNQSAVDEYFTYDRLGELTEGIIGSWVGNYDFNKDGNISNRTENGTSEDFGYDFDGDGVDESNMLTSVGSNDLVDWDDNGNLICDGINTFAYNYDNMVEAAVNIVDPDITSIMTYDSMGYRAAKTVTDENGVATTRKYLWDYSGSLPKVLVELEFDGDNWNPVAKNFYYSDRIFQSKHANGIGGFDSRYYVHDRNGNIRSIINKYGQELNTYDYTPFGGDLQVTETVENNWKFTGQYYDKEIWQYYLRARQYSPYLARFNGYDPIYGAYEEPLTLHQYLYCLNDSINRTDLSGKYSLAGMMMAGGIRNMIAGLYDMGMNAIFVGYDTHLKGGSVNDGLKAYSTQVASSLAIGAALGYSIIKTMDLLDDMAAGVARELTPEDLGIKGNVTELKGIVTKIDDITHIQLDMIEGNIKNPRDIIKHMTQAAKANGSKHLVMEGNFANEKLIRFLEKIPGADVMVGGTKDCVIFDLKKFK